MSNSRRGFLLALLLLAVGCGGVKQGSEAETTTTRSPTTSTTDASTVLCARIDDLLRRRQPLRASEQRLNDELNHAMLTNSPQLETLDEQHQASLRAISDLEERILQAEDAVQDAPCGRKFCERPTTTTSASTSLPKDASTTSTVTVPHRGSLTRHDMMTLDDDNLTQRMWDHIAGLNFEDDNSPLGTYDIVGLFEVDVENGGFEQYFQNNGLDDAPAVEAALKRMGASPVAALVDRAASALQHDPDLLATLNDWCQQVPDDNPLSVFDNEYESMAPSLTNYEAAFIRKNIDAFRPIDG